MKLINTDILEILFTLFLNSIENYRMWKSVKKKQLPA